jgi:hypothetical protein
MDLKKVANQATLGPEMASLGMDSELFWDGTWQRHRYAQRAAMVLSAAAHERALKGLETLLDMPASVSGRCSLVATHVKGASHSGSPTKRSEHGNNTHGMVWME